MRSNITQHLAANLVCLVAATHCGGQGIWDPAHAPHERGVIVDVTKGEAVPVDDGKAITGEWELTRDAKSQGGTLLRAPADRICPDAAVDLSANGWHAIYVGFVRPARQSRFGGTGAAVRLSRDAYRLPLIPAVGRREVFFKNADVTGQQIIFSNILERPAAIDYVRLVPLDAKQVKAIQAGEQAPRAMDVAAICDSNMHYRLYGSARRRDVFDMVASHQATGFNKLYYIGNTGTLFYQTNVADRYTADGDIEGNKSAATIHRFPVLRDAVAAGRKVGIKVFGWYRMNNEFGSRGHELPALCSQLFLSRPDLRCVHQNGKRDDSKLSYAFEEVRQYRLAIMKEMASFGVDGLMLGFRRHPPMMRYEEPLVAAYTKKHGVSPRKIDARKNRAEYLRWIQFRADVMTEFIRELKRELTKMGKAGLPIAVRVRAQSFEQNLGECVDLKTWVKEGLVNEIHAFAGYSHNVPPVEIPARLQPIVDLCRGTGIKVYGGSQDRTVRDAVEMRDAVAFVHASGADGITVYESEAMVALPQIRPVTANARARQRVARPWLMFSSAATAPAFPWQPHAKDASPWWQMVMDPLAADSRIVIRFDGPAAATLSAASARGALRPAELAAGDGEMSGRLPRGTERVRVSVPAGCAHSLTALRVEEPGKEAFEVGYRETRMIEVVDLAAGQVLDRPRPFEVKVAGTLAGEVASINYFIDGRLASVERAAPYFFGGDYHQFDVRRLGAGAHELRITLGDDVLRSPWQRTYPFEVAVPDSFGKGNLCAKANGAEIASAANNRWGGSRDWTPTHLIDGSVKADHPKKTCWMCKKTGHVVIKLARRATVRRVVLSNYYTDIPYTRQAKGVALSLSETADGPFKEVATVALARMINRWDAKAVRIDPTPARFLKMSVTSNYGHSDQSVVNLVEAYER